MERNIHKIHYISTLPGAGKTEYAVRRIAKIAQNSLVLYVGPTIKLLEEVAERLHGAGVQVRIVHSIGKNSTSVVERLRATITGKNKFIKIETPGMTKGVILCSHDCFLRIPKDNDFLDRSKIHLVFDEVRKCVSETATLNNVSAEMATNLANLFGIPSMNSKYIEVSTTNINNQKFWDTFGCNSTTRKSYKMLADLLDNAKIVDANSIWLRMIPDRGKITVHVVLMPMKVFYGWKSCLIMAAFFEDSQMYHMLRRNTEGRLPDEGIRDHKIRLSTNTDYLQLIDVTNKVINKGRMDQIRKRLSKVNITYIFDDFPISKYKLLNYVLVDKGKFDGKKFQELAEPVLGRLNTTLGKIMDMLHQYRDHKSAAALIKYLNSTGIDTKIVSYMCDIAVEANRVWYERIGKFEKVLPVTINKMYEDVDSQVTVMPFHAHGLNTYKKHHTIGYFAAINAKPEVESLLTSLCPKYEPHLDYMMEQAIQSLMRCSVRDVKCETPVLMIVPDATMAMDVKSRLFNLPNIIEMSSLGIDVEKEPIRAYTERSGSDYNNARKALYRIDQNYREWIKLTRKGEKEAADRIKARHHKEWSEIMARPSIVSVPDTSLRKKITQKLYATKTYKRYTSLRALKSMGRLDNDTKINNYRNNVREMRMYLETHTIEQLDEKYYHLVA